MPRAPLTIVDLLGRGKTTYEAFLARTFTPETMPLGTSSLNIVTRGDFVLHADMCLGYVTPTRSLHILDDSGRLFALLSSHRNPSILVHP
jgi:hypothetical protein